MPVPKLIPPPPYLFPNVAAACARPNGWCDPSAAGANNNWVLRAADCDGDGVTDWVCTDRASHRWVIRSTAGCAYQNGADGSGNAPDSYCPALLACARPNYWCDPNAAGSNNNWILRAADCDGDGVTDWVCTDDARHHGVIRSTAGCATGAETGWRTAPDSYCPALF
ncbi:hypothetical protein TSOC_009589, partial [Tetrabaena socialis]